MADDFVQVAPDSVGKKIDMSSVSTSAGLALYRQRAELVGDPAETLSQILSIQQKQLAVLRALLALRNNGNNTPAFEDDYLNID